MRDKTEQILAAAAAAFIKKGFQATTQEIAKEADVAEITLFRKFSTKQNLFITVMKKVLETQFDAKLMKLAEEENTEVFLKEVINNRLDVLSENAPMVRMLISESLMGNLTEELQLPEIIFNSIKKALDHHFQRKEIPVDTELCARQLGGIFLSYIILPNDRPYHNLKTEEKNALLERYTKSVLSML
ncbi:TetR/AcrR family transcriptional regulator [Cytobacillus oceanisediminis]|uniref:TetR/AcrR family transcriptional regulator n=1 Tax=Cytobacillus oceanisediminis TaxID=665099 RepID=UPI001F558C6E|nr:TetR/AcrR family transcriptional regulator [Cytobacillus oceanisediminis]